MVIRYKPRTLIDLLLTQKQDEEGEEKSNLVHFRHWHDLTYLFVPFKSSKNINLIVFFYKW